MMYPFIMNNMDNTQITAITNTELSLSLSEAMT